MAYTTIEKVNKLLSVDNQVDTETYPSYADVESWLPDLDAALNVAFVTGGGSLTVPLDPASDLAIWFGLLEAKEAAYMRMQVPGATKDKEALWQGYHDDWNAALTKISDKQQAIATTTPTSTVGSPSSYQDQEPAFKRDKVY